MNWYRIDFYTDKDAEYVQAKDDHDILDFMDAWPDRQDVMEIYLCKNNEHLTADKLIYPA